MHVYGQELPASAGYLQLVPVHSIQDSWEQKLRLANLRRKGLPPSGLL